MTNITNSVREIRKRNFLENIFKHYKQKLSFQDVFTLSTLLVKLIKYPLSLVGQTENSVANIY